MAIPVTVLRRNSGRNLVGMKTSSSKTYGRAEQVSIQAGAALVAADTPLVSPSSFTGSTLVVDVAASADIVKMVLLSPKMVSGQFGVATDWAVVGADTSSSAGDGAPIFASTTDGAIAFDLAADATAVQVGVVVGAAAVAGYILLKPGSF